MDYKIMARLPADMLFDFHHLSFFGITTGFGTTQGFSYALGYPAYEDGPKDNPKKRYHFQYHMAFELAFGLASEPEWGAGIRLHHRSGAYGLIAPPHTGTNFLGLFIQKSF